MIEFAHILAGGALGSIFSNDPRGLFWAFIFGFSSHFLLDRIPHWQYHVKNRFEKVNFQKQKIGVLKVLIDTFLGFLMIFILARAANNLIAILAGGFAGALPDGLRFLADLKPENSLSKLYSKLHDALHLKNNELTPLWRGVINTITVILVAMWILRFV